MNIYELAKNKVDVMALQHTLTETGWLDLRPIIVLAGQNTSQTPFDGIMGPDTESAIRRRFSVKNNIITDPGWDTNPDVAFENKIKLTPNEPASMIVGAMIKAGYWISVDPNTLNIVYLEGVNENFSLNDNMVDEWNDLRILIRIMADGTPTIVRQYVATTGPGKYYIENPMNPYGCARIAFGQYKAWIDGFHKGAQPALQQCGPILVYRDLNKDGSREGDKQYIVNSTVNQHSTSDTFKGDLVGKWSAGCLVAKYMIHHQDFLRLLRTDARYQANKGYVFMTTVMNGRDIF